MRILRLAPNGLKGGFDMEKNAWLVVVLIGALALLGAVVADPTVAEQLLDVLLQLALAVAQAAEGLQGS